jgi:hypothetical protein|tara:strand:- start:18024 stop:18866 length:843 start_codon:yes stop_codon:yes gene_type:complete
MSQKINASFFRRSLKTSEWNFKCTELNKEESSLLLYKNININAYIHRIFELHGFFLMTCKFEYSGSSVLVNLSFLEHLIYDKKVSSYIEKKSISSKKDSVTKLVNLYLIPVLNNYFYKKVSVFIKVNDLGKDFENSILRSKPYKIEHKNIMKRFKFFRNYDKSDELIKIAFVTVMNKKSSKLLAKTISYLITNQKRRHSNILSFVKKLFDILIPLKLSNISGLRLVVAGRLNGFPRAKKRLLKIGSLPLQSLNAPIDYSETVAYTPNGTFGIKVWVCGKN